MMFAAVVKHFRGLSATVTSPVLITSTEPLDVMKSRRGQNIVSSLANRYNAYKTSKKYVRDSKCQAVEIELKLAWHRK